MVSSEDDLDDSEEMYAEVGYFIAQYSTVEMAVTVLLAIVSEVKDLEAFHSLTRGMDAKVKVERLRELSKPKNLIPKKSNFDVRLEHFAEKTSNLRNKIAHAWLLRTRGDHPMMIFANVGKLPFDLFGMKRRHRNKPDEISFEALSEHSLWLASFQEDILSLIPSAKKGAAFEIKNPRSREPTELLRHVLQIELRAKKRKPRQTPLKK